MTEPLWKLRPDIVLHRRCWDDGCVLYDEVSGRTVFVDDLGSALLDRLQEVPESTPMLIAWLAREYDMDAAEIHTRQVVKRLRELQAVDFLQTESP